MVMEANKGLNPEYLKKVSEWWGEISQEGTAELVPHVADQDGTPGLYYFDSDRSLAFHWDGFHDHPIEVSYGGDHEVPSWCFRWERHRPPSVIAGTWSLCLAFGMACRDWIEAKEDAR